ncbi:MAG: serine/threonine protein kinase [Polyangiaceae bacterium]|nr:serine/threonine protein kinase [Polyangiaceae bacterium]
MAQDLPPGTLLAGRYRIGAPLGRGGYGTVYRAVDETTGTPMALKHLHARRLDSAIDLERFAREAEFLRRLDHPNIVRALGSGHTPDGEPFLVCELLDGVSLRAVLKTRAPLSLEATTAIAVELLRALEAAHAQGIVHRDVKPANVFVPRPGTTGRVRILDFGIAKAIGAEASQHARLTATGQTIGTPAYMSPEQAFGREVGPASDLYALGLVLAEVLGGVRVVTGASALDQLLQHAAPEPHRLTELVARSPLGPILARAIEKSYAARYPSAAQMRRDVEQAVPAASRARTLTVTTTLEVAAVADARAPLAAPVPVATTALDLRAAPARGATGAGRWGLVAAAVIAVAGATAAGVVAASSGGATGAASAARPSDGTAAPTVSSRNGPPGDPAPPTAPARPTAGSPTSLATLDLAELRRRAEGAGVRIDEASDAAGPMMRVGFEIVGQREGRPAMASYAAFQSSEAADLAQHAMTSAGYAVRREGDVMLCAWVEGDATATRELLAELTRGRPADTAP